jgi:hypothetical protein
MKSSIPLPFLAACALAIPATVGAKAPSNLEEALKCVFFVTAFDKNKQPLGHGSAFLLEEDGVQWIHTNAHVIERAARIEFKDLQGKTVTGFGRFACFSEGSGTVTTGEKDAKGKPKAVRYGGDGVRLELKAPREFAFTPQKDPAGIRKGHQVITLGDNDGDKKMETLEGDIVLATERVVMTSCKTRPGSSGGVLIDAEDFTAIGLNTWGVPGSSVTLETLWQQDPAEPASDLAGASLLHKAAWTQLPAAEFLKGSEKMARFLDTARVLSLIYHTTPTKSGFKLKLDDAFAGPVTYRLALERYRRHPILGPVADLNDKLARAEGGNIGVNNMEVVKTYARAIEEIRRSYLKESAAILKETPPYYRIEMEKLGYLAFGEECHKNLQNAEDWFSNKASVGGTMPVGVWFELPPLSEFGPQDR